MAEPVFRVMVQGCVVNEWQFDRILVWELEAETALAQELPGLAALVPLMKGVRWELMERAVRQVEAKAPAEQQADLLAILRAFGESKYTVEQLERLIGRERLMESSIYKWGLEEGHAKGLAEGLMTNAREVCRDAVRKWHPHAGADVWSAIEDCTDIAALNEVTVNANQWRPEDILRRLAAQ